MGAPPLMPKPLGHLISLLVDDSSEDAILSLATNEPSDLSNHCRPITHR
jgi:hypothetical protein